MRGRFVCILYLSMYTLYLARKIWFLSGAWEYIESTRDIVRDLEKRVRLAKTNVEAMCNIMAKWCESPLYQRKGGKKDSLLNLEVREPPDLSQVRKSLVGYHRAGDVAGKVVRLLSQ